MCEFGRNIFPGAFTERGRSGEYGMGTMANELTLGCDCLGKIHYLVSGDTEMHRLGC